MNNNNNHNHMRKTIHIVIFTKKDKIRHIDMDINKSNFNIMYSHTDI